MKKSSIDIGSNSILLLFGELQSDGKFKEVGQDAQVVGLGKGIDQTGVFSDEKMNLAYEVLNKYKNTLQENGYDLEKTIVTATEASRNAKNSTEFFTRIQKDLGFNVSIITPEGEAYYTAFGIFKSIDANKDFVIMDLGGASTELIHVEVNPFKISKMTSLKSGSVRSLEWLNSNSYEKKLNEILNCKEFSTPHIVGVAGTMTTLASMYLNQKSFGPQAINNLVVSTEEFIEFIKNVDNLENYPTAESRKDTIMSGAKLACDLLEYLGVQTLGFSTYGLRYGLVYNEKINQEFCVL